MNSLKKILGGNTRQFGMIFALIAVVLFFQWQTGGKTLTPANMMNLFNGNSYILILAIGMVLVIIAGHIDLSVGSVAAFVGIVVAIAMRDWGFAWWVGVLLGLALGAGYLLELGPDTGYNNLTLLLGLFLVAVVVRNEVMRRGRLRALASGPSSAGWSWPCSTTACSCWASARTPPRSSRAWCC